MNLFIQIITGVFFGILFGFIPSLHINVIGYFIILLGIFSFQLDFLFFLSFSISQLITSIIPAIIFGVPTDQTINNLFSGQRMFLLGKAKQAIILSFIGYFLGVFFAILLLPLLYLLFTLFASFYILIILVILFVLFLFIFEQKTHFSKLIVITMILFSGVLGIITLKYNYFFKEPIFVCIFGLFGAPTLIVSLFSTKKVVQETTVDISIKKPFLSSFFGAISSLFVIIIPSLSTAQSGLIISKIRKKLTSEEYLILFSSVSISTLIFSYFLSIFFNKSRLGFISLLLSNKIIVPSINLFLFIITIIFAMVFTILILFLLLDGFLKIVNSLNQFLINTFILIFSVFLILLISGPTAIILLFASTAIGFLPLVFNKPRVILMSYIMFPTLFYFI